MLKIKIIFNNSKTIKKNISLLFVWNKISAYFIHRPLTFSSDRFSASLRYFLFSEFLSENNLSLSVHFAFEVNRCRIWIPKGFEFPVIHLKTWLLWLSKRYRPCETTPQILHDVSGRRRWIKSVIAVPCHEVQLRSCKRPFGE